MNPADAMSREEMMAFLVRTRGDIFGEVATIVAEAPETMYLIRQTSGYVHYYDELTTPDQVLSGPMRELIALAQLCAKGDGRFAANHVRRLYRFGITDGVMIEAGEAIAPVVGWSTILQIARSIETAKDPSYPNGKMPEGGAPTELTPFPEMEQGGVSSAPSSDSLADLPEWEFVASLDPELAWRATAFVDHCLLADPAQRPERVLKPGVRELIAIPALCARGEVDLAAAHIKRAYRFGMTRRQVLEAISCVLPMTGTVTVLIGVRAMKKAESDGGDLG